MSKKSPLIRRSDWRIFNALLVAELFVPGLASEARAHPHILAEARFDVLVDSDGVVTGLKHLWRFDELFSSTVIVEFDKDGDWKLGEAELQAVSQTIFQSLAEFDYFQVVTVDGTDRKMSPPAELLAYFEDQQLIVLFETAPRDRLQLKGTVSFGIYDPTFYTAIEFLEDEYMATEGLSAACRRTVVRPDPDEAIAENQETLTEAFFTDPTDYSKIFATRLEVVCPDEP